jgi:hypothetical protein
MERRVRYNAGMRLRLPVLAVLAVPLAASLVSAGAAHPEFQVKRQGPFAFVEAPTVTQDGDRVTIRFKAKAFCDATVAIEDTDGQIIRHLACGVLGKNAPDPFQRNALAQTLVWDGKDDKGRYVEGPNAVKVRVSLGLEPAFDRDLFWSLYKRVGGYPPILCAAEEGVYVFDGGGVDFVRLYSHEGDYVRTIYPFPAGSLGRVRGLEQWMPPQTGRPVPRKRGYVQGTLLTSGSSAVVAPRVAFGNGFGASTMAVHDGRIALAFLSLNRLRSDGTSGGLPLSGPKTGFQLRKAFRTRQTFDIGPTSSAFSPDGKWLYLTGYVWKYGIYSGGGHCRHAVYRLNYAGDAPPEVFAGALRQSGRDHAHFAVPNSVACDARGRVYVADYLNDRVQVFDPAGRHLKTIAAPKPARVQIDPRNGELYVFSWFLGVGISNQHYRDYELDWKTFRRMEPTLTRFGPFEQPKRLDHWPLPLPGSAGGRFMLGQLYHVEIDFHARRPTLWVVARKRPVNQDEITTWGKQIIERVGADRWLGGGIVLHRLKGGAWVPIRNFAREAHKAIVRVKPPALGIQRLYANERNHKLYLLEHLGFSKSHHELIEIDPDMGAVRPVKLPFRAEDICFDPDGRIYLRTDREVVRYDPATWREVPWDYGERRAGVSFGGQPRADVVSALPLPGHRPMWFHQYGMWVSSRGHLAVSCCNRGKPPTRDAPGAWKGGATDREVKPYNPALFPGRARHQEIHVWDRHGKLIREDAVPGLGIFHGLGIDRDDCLYVMSQGTRHLAGAPYPNRQTGTLIKFRPRERWGEVKVVSGTRNVKKRYVPYAPILLPKNRFPERPPDTVGRGENGPAWMTGAEWHYGGVGIVGAGCICWHTRFCIDRFARSFAPEPDLYGVAILDTNGNLIARVGRYGNVDDDGPALFYPAYVAADTDRRLFVSDVGNGRIVSIRLDYRTSATLPLGRANGAQAP